MVIKALMRLFGGGRSEETAADVKTASTAATAERTSVQKSKRTSFAENKESVRSRDKDSAVSMKDLENFVEYVAKTLVDIPDDVSVTSEDKNGWNVIQICCRQLDRGKIIGKKGKTIMALRSLLSGAAGRMQDRVTVEVLDDDEEVKD